MSDALVYLWGAFLENFWYLIVFGYGAIVGSFLNVLIYRMPLGMSVSKPASHCPNCNHYLGFWDNIPLFAFLVLKGRCRYCRIPISWRYFTVELLTACLWTALFYQVANRSPISWADFLAQALFASVLISVIFIDLDYFIIPDELNWIGIGLGLGRDIACLLLAHQAGSYILSQANDHYAYFGWLPRSIPGALLYGGAMYAVSLVGFLVYARGEKESLGSAAYRFFKLQDLPQENEEEDEAVRESEETSEVEEEPEGEPVRLRFSPAFLAICAAVLLIPAIHAWAALFFLAPLAAFVALTTRSGESLNAAIRRFFHSNDLEGPMPTAPKPEPVMEEEELPLLPGDERLKQKREESSEPAPISAAPALAATAGMSEAEMMAAEANQFALEAETGQHGAMGLGDVKLALAIGAMLGPGPAMVSLFFATASGALTGIILARLHGRGLKLAIPFGPFMALGAIIMMLYGSDLLTWYMGLYQPHRVP